MANIKYQPVGKRALLAMLIEKIPLLIILLVAVYVINRYGSNFLPTILLNIIPIPWWPVGIIISIIVLATYFQYLHYGIEIFNSGLNYFYGLIFQTQIGIPFHKIKEITITKTLGGHLLGINTVFVTLMGLSETEPNLTEKTVPIAYLNDTIAHAVQEAILAQNKKLKLITCLKQ
jgi:uncharacterized membrane protein YdbT with pleckstrin-like domain